MPTYLTTAVSPFIYAEGWSNRPLAGYAPPTGAPQVPITLNQTFYIESGSVFVPGLGGPQGTTVTGWKTTFINTGMPAVKKVMLLGDSTNASLNDAYDFFNVIPDSGSNVKTNGVFQIAVAGTRSGTKNTMFQAYKQMLLSKRGKYTVNMAYFPYTGPNNPAPSRNQNGIQRGSLITCHTKDWFSFFVFELPQDIRTKLNVIY